MDDFSSKYDKLQNNTSSETLASKNHEGEGTGRNVCFIKEDGNAIFLGYGYLVSCELLKEESTIILSFTSHTITLKGIRLELLYHSFMSHSPKTVVCSDERYNETEMKQPLINSIEVVKNK